MKLKRLLATQLQNNASVTHEGNKASEEAEDSTLGFADQDWSQPELLAVIESMDKRIRLLEDENVQLIGKINELIPLLPLPQTVAKPPNIKDETTQKDNGVALTDSNDAAQSVQNAVPTQLNKVQEQKSYLVESEAIQELRTVVARLNTDVSFLQKSIDVESIEPDDRLVTQKYLENQNKLNKFKFDGKCGLIEKILGIDITTSGAKPNDILELLHNRLWHLEERLPIGDLNSKANMYYVRLKDHARYPTSHGNWKQSFPAMPTGQIQTEVSLNPSTFWDSHVFFLVLVS